MKLAANLVLLAFSVPVLLPAGDFNDLVREFSLQTGAHETKIPFLGFARFVVGVARPTGVSDFKLAVFEDVHGHQPDFIDTAEGVVSKDGWNRIVRVRSKNGESTAIYMRPEGKRVRMLITTVDAGDAVFVETRIKPEQIVKFVDEHKCDRR